MHRTFVLRRQLAPDVAPDYFNGWRIRYRSIGPPESHYEAKWEEGHASIISEEEITQLKKDLWDRLKLAEGIDYNRVQVG